MTTRAPRRALAAALLSSGCIVTGSGGVYDGSTSGSGVGVTSFGATSSGQGDTTSAKLDVGPGDVAAMECSSIEQTTTIVERPSDVVVVADDDVDPALVQSVITNLLPAMETEGVFDANVVLVVGTDPPYTEGDAFSCGEWNCRGAGRFGAFTVVQHSVASGSVLTDLLSAVDAWSPVLRDASWKHVWALSSTQNTSTEAPLLLDLLEAATDPGVVVHAVVTEDGAGDPNGLAGLASQTGGQYAQGDFVLYDFLAPMLQRIRGTALACEYEIPAPPAGFVFEPGRVNVDYDEGDGLEVIGNVPSADACVGVSGGWYYDDPVDPDRIVMCPQTCTRFEALAQASIEIRFGCSTIPAA
ncbi:MAG: hypothetical protein ACE37F_13395 [Nannocystaceae bacterium]|nr:hypothetical protein [bacterium]